MIMQLFQMDCVECYIMSSVIIITTYLLEVSLCRDETFIYFPND